ncbi:SDR family oxidoreductase [Kineococcus rhizosphaerae]|uniref:Gluconate 5-dehydrogenase n=1 Tax=Kineococcus rhizosphaerae TaxID=559628 RepID=A0A2T0R3R5_9ACTN|nr:SDR family oxidoreductase [Kineococcus rhizosphaerae]PRY14684.1 gluconate 5-dehydrogenase [Kineococcus rhizosphaerae]
MTTAPQESRPPAPDPARLFDVTGRVALVTGSTRGIGHALASGLVRAGATVVVNGRDPQVAEQVAAGLAALGPGRTVARAFDVTDPAAVEQAVAGLEADGYPVEILVNNTGMQQRAPFTEFSDADWARMLDVNLSSAFYVARSVARRMRDRGHGKIVNVLSVQSEVVRPGIAPYSATKGGLKMLTKGMCADLAGSGIQVNALGPGYFATELTAALVADAEFSRWVEGRTPAGRWGQVEDLVGALLFFASDASAFVNGQVLHVDGGMLSVL